MEFEMRIQKCQGVPWVSHVKTSLGRATRYAAEAEPGAESRETDRRTGDGEVSLEEIGDVRVRTL